MPQKIFISYRREDSAANALGIGQYLEHEFERKNVFLDIDMRARTKFPIMLEQRLAECKVMIVLIGPNWLNSRDDQAQRRLENPDDWVRLEIAHALKRNITVIPVRVNRATLPSKTMLPEEIRGLLDHQAVSVSTPSFRSDMAGMAKDIRSIPSSSPWRRFGAVAAGLLVVLVGAVVLASGFTNVIERVRPLLSSQAPATQSQATLTNNSIWNSAPGEWIMFAVDRQPIAFYFKRGSVKSFGDDKVVFTGRIPVDPTNSTVQLDKTSAYQDDVTVLTCKQPNWAIAERAIYNKSGEVLSHYKWDDPEKLDLSIGGQINAGSIYSMTQYLMCDEQLRTPLLTPQQIADMKLSHLSSTPTGDGEIFYGPPKDTSNIPYLEGDVVFNEISSRSYVHRPFFRANCAWSSRQLSRTGRPSTV